METTLPERLVKKFSVAECGCWLWNASLNIDGYGQIWWNGTTRRAHRVVFELLREPCPTGVEADHLCRTRNCVNPDHLDWVPTKVNTLRGEGVTAHNARKTHCKYGHEYTPENTYFRPTKKRPGRHCRACARQRQRSRREATR